MYSSITNSPTTQFYLSLSYYNFRDISNRIRNLKVMISTEETCFRLHFFHSSKRRFYSNFPSFRWRIAFTYGFPGVAWH
jgi:hypothetical protein